MLSNAVRWLMVVGAIVALPVAGYAQEAAITGTVTDETGAVLPGATVTALLQATGNTFVAITDERGIYRIAARVGVYQITTELPSFATVERSGVQLLVGQTATINVQMSPSTVQETVTVTAEAPLLNVTTSSIGGNVDPQQVQELPVNGRNWMALALLAPGSRTSSTNATTPLPDRNGGEAREFQLNMDGQQVSVDMGTGGQARFSQDSIAEFQFLSNRFDATQGRSSGVQVNAISRSGTNRLSGLFRSNFRDSRLNAKNPCSIASSPSTISSSARRSVDRSCRTGFTTSPISSTSVSLGRASGTLPIPRSTSSSRGPRRRKRAASASTINCRPAPG